MRIDVSKRPGNHLETGVVGLMVRQPLHKNTLGLEHALTQFVKLPRVQIAIAGMFGVQGIHRHHIVSFWGDREIIAAIVQDDMEPWVSQHMVIHLWEKMRGSYHFRDKLHEIELLQRIARHRPGCATSTKTNHQSMAWILMQKHRQMRQ